MLAFLPYLRHEPPTQHQTGNKVELAGQSSLKSVDTSQEGEVTANSVGDPYGTRQWRSSMVQLSGKNRALNELSVERMGEETDQHLVMLHGYGAGLGFFYKNFEPLTRAKGWHLYALDMLGMGRSTRPPFHIKAKKREDQIREAESWFIDALEEWRVKRRIERFTLLGHSLGGYMAVAYALKYPGRLNKLLLASPVGVPEDPYAVRGEVPEPQETTMASEFTQDQHLVADERNVTGSDTTDALRTQMTISNNDNDNTGSSSSGHIASRVTSKNGNSSPNAPPRRTLPKWFAYLWDANISPFTFVRWAGPFGPRLVSGWTYRRFSHLPEEEAKALHTYSYTVFRMRGSGEYALAYILAPGAFARSPLIRRIHEVGRQIIKGDTPSPSQTQPRRENGVPVVFLYGDHDWMDVSGGYAAKEKIDAERERVLRNATPEECQADKGSAKVIIIKRSGHHVYLDGWEDFNRAILDEMEDVRRLEKKPS